MDLSKTSKTEAEKELEPVNNKNAEHFDLRQVFEDHSFNSLGHYPGFSSNCKDVELSFSTFM